MGEPMHVGSFLREAQRDCPEQPVWVGAGSARWTYRALHTRAVALSRWLQDAARAEIAFGGDGREETEAPVVGIFVQSNEDFVIAFFAVTYAGMAALPFVRNEPPARLAERLARTGAVLLITDEVAPLGRTRSGVRVVHPMAGENANEAIDVDGNAIASPARLQRAPDDTALLLFTSGTSGRSKVARISHRCLVTHTRNLVSGALRLGPKDRVLATLPLCHSFGLRTTLLASICARATIVLAERFEPTHTLSLAEEHGVTFIAGVPTMFAAWGQTEGSPLPALRWCLSAGAPLPDAVRRRAEARLGAEVREGYGLTEATFSAMNAPPAPAASGTCGRPSPGVEIRIRDGEIQVRGPNVMQGYLHDAEATAATFDDGWLRTGDLGHLDEAGRVVVRDRLKDLILRGGHNVVPAEVEAVLREVPGVRGAAVVGAPCERLGEEVVAVLVIAPETDGATVVKAVEAKVRQHLPKGDWPRRYVGIDAMPVGPSRKVLRRVLRERLMAGELDPLSS